MIASFSAGGRDKVLCVGMWLGLLGRQGFCCVWFGLLLF